MIFNQGFDHHGLTIMELTRGFDSLAHLLTGSATVAAIVISQSVAVHAKTGEEVYQIAVPVTVQINSDISSGTGVIIAQDGNSAAAYFHQATARYNLKDYQGAISDYDKAIKIDPNNAYAYIGRGVAFYLVGDKRKARGDWEKSAQLFRQQGNEDGYKSAMDNIRNLK